MKKLVRPADEDMVRVRTVIECFKDHWAFTEISNEDGSLIRDLMFDHFFLDSDQASAAAEPQPGPESPLRVEEAENGGQDSLEDGKCSIPKLMLLGLLYCRSNRR